MLLALRGLPSISVGILDFFRYKTVIGPPAFWPDPGVGLKHLVGEWREL